MPTALPTAAGLDEIAALARAEPALRLLLLYGSRARGDAHELSDWDFGFIADPGFDELALEQRIASHLASEIQLVDLDRASGVLRYQAARDGRVVHDRDGDGYERFWLAAVTFWCDAESILRAGHDATLARLGSA